MIAHRSLSWMANIACIWWPRCKSFDSATVHGGITLLFFRGINNEFSSKLPPEVDWFNAHKFGS